MNLLELFISFFKVGMFSIGGGYAALPLIQNQVVHVHQWLTLEMFSDVITIAEMTPGPIALNAATFVGNQVAGVPGAVVSTIGVITPSFIILSLLSYLYFKYKQLDVVQAVLKGIRPAVVALILGAGLSILILSLFGHSKEVVFEHFNYLHLLFVMIAFVMIRKFKWHPILVMVSVGLLNVLFQSFV